MERRAKTDTSLVRVARRARIIPMCADGVPLRQIGNRVGMDQLQVGVWRCRLSHRLDGLSDRPRSGRPGRVGPAASGTTNGWRWLGEADQVWAHPPHQVFMVVVVGRLLEVGRFEVLWKVAR